MAKNSLAKSLFAFAACAFIVVGAVAGIKYVFESDGNDDDSIYIPPTTSERPPASSETNSDPNTSEEPPTSEEPIEVMPAPLFDGHYSEYLADGINAFNLEFADQLKPSSISAASYQSYNGLLDTGRYYFYNTYPDQYSYSLETPIIANSMRWDNTTSHFVLGFTDNTINNRTYEEFYTIPNGDTFKYASAFIFNFTLSIEDCLYVYPNHNSDNVSMYYRTNVIDGWQYYGTDSAFELELSHWESEETNIQFALVHHANNKASRVTIKPDMFINYPI